MPPVMALKSKHTKVCFSICIHRREFFPGSWRTFLSILFSWKAPLGSGLQPVLQNQEIPMSWAEGRGATPPVGAKRSAGPALDAMPYLRLAGIGAPLICRSLQAEFLRKAEPRTGRDRLPQVQGVSAFSPR